MGRQTAFLKTRDDLIRGFNVAELSIQIGQRQGQHVGRRHDPPIGQPLSKVDQRIRGNGDIMAKVPGHARG